MRRGRAAGFAVACALMAACTSPTSPASRFVPLSVAYVHVAPQGARDITEAASCAHHYAPSNLQIQTSWGESARFDTAPGGVLRAELQARRGGEYWLSFFDIRYCGYGSGIVPPGGVSVNEVLLTTRDQVNGLTVFRFRVDADGTVRP